MTATDIEKAMTTLQRVAGKPWAPIYIRDEDVRPKVMRRRQRRPSLATIIKQA
jgi:hypothetical protein